MNRKAKQVTGSGRHTGQASAARGIHCRNQEVLKEVLGKMEKGGQGKQHPGAVYHTREEYHTKER